MDLETQRLLKRILPLWTTLGVALLVLSFAAILHLGRDVFVPVALAMLLSFVLAPAVRALQRLALPQGAAVLVTVLIAFGAIAGLATIVGSQLAGLGADIPRYQKTISEKIGALGTAATPGGTMSRAVEAVHELGRDLSRLGGSASGGEGGDLSNPAEGRPVPVIVKEGSGIVGTLGVFVSPLLHPLATTFLVLIFVLFVLGAREDLRNRVVRLLGTEDIQATTAVIDDAAGRLSRLFLMQLAINTAFGVVIGIGLWVIGIPSPLLWGVLAGIMRFVPYVGAVVGALPPLALAFAVDPGWTMLIWTVLLFVLVEPILGHVIEPFLFGHSTGLSPVAVILAATVWTFLWGPIGLVLATPITVCLVVMGRHIDGLAFLDILLGDRPALSPPEIFYQRMLAGDPTEAIGQAREFLRERSLSTYYDEVALAALRLAHEDVARGRLTRERQEVVRRSTAVLIDMLDNLKDPRPKGGQVGAEAAAAVQAAGPDLQAARLVLSPSDLRPEWRGAAAVLCVARPGTLDEVVARMCAQVLVKHGIGARTLAVNAEGSVEADTLAPQVRLVVLSYFEPLSTLHLRHAVRVARGRFRGVRAVLGIWRERDGTIGRVLGRAARADVVAPTTGAVLADTLALAMAGPAGRAAAAATRPPARA